MTETAETPTKVASTKKPPKKKTAEALNYEDIMAEVEKPIAERENLVRGRDGELHPGRKYHLNVEQKAKLVEESKALGSSTVNPCRRHGIYWSQVEALIQLGVNEYHSLKSVRDKMQEIMTPITKTKKRGDKEVEVSAWQDFYEKPGRETATKPRDGEGKIVQNFEVLQRLPKNGKKELNAYGYPLKQFCMSIDIERREVAEGVPPVPFFCLNTTWKNMEDVMPKKMGGQRKKKVETIETETGQDAAA